MENEILTTNEELNEKKVMDDHEESENSGGVIGKIVFGLGVAAAAGLAAFAYNKPKREERTIEKLRKKGYVIYKDDECEVREVEEDDFEDVEKESD